MKKFISFMFKSPVCNILIPIDDSLISIANQHHQLVIRAKNENSTSIMHTLDFENATASNNAYLNISNFVAGDTEKSLLVIQNVYSYHLAERNL